jgi:carotenoid cleavage dioxygenase-like enzyme
MSPGMNRRGFIGGMTAASALAGSGVSMANEKVDSTVHFPNRPPGLGMPFRAEVDIFDCDVEGRIPDDLSGCFYRVGPDFQYPPKYPNNIPFDGEGHVSMFRIANGHVDLKSRYVRTQRFKVQQAARKAVFGIYRNPFTDDPGLENVSRGTANTTVVYHNGKLLALKEDSPPVAMDPLTLETTDDYLTFDGKLTSKTFTAHPKFDPGTGEMIGFGYEAKGFGSDDIAVYAIDKDGNISWEAWIKVPYVGMVHDFAVTQKHIAFLVIPMAYDLAQMKAEGVHFSWDSKLPTWFGVMRRGGDGSDIRWFEGPERCATHVMGAWSDGDTCYVDMDMAHKNQFPFFPNRHGEPFDPVGAAGVVTRLKVDLSTTAERYDMEVLYPNNGVLPRQDDRYQTVPYRYGFMPTVDYSKPPHPAFANMPFRPNNHYTMFDHSSRTAKSYFAGGDVALQEPCFVPRRKGAPEGDGYLVGMAGRVLEGGRSDLLILDTDDIEAGPIATVQLPFRFFGQVHGWWVAGEDLPDA